MLFKSSFFFCINFFIFIFILFYFDVELDYIIIYLYLKQQTNTVIIKYANIFDIITINIKFIVLLIFCIFFIIFIFFFFKYNLILQLKYKQHKYNLFINYILVINYYIVLCFYYFYFSYYTFNLLLTYQNKFIFLNFELFFIEYFDFWKTLTYFYIVLLVIYIFHLFFCNKIIIYNLFNKLIFFSSAFSGFFCIGKFFFIGIIILFNFCIVCFCFYLLFNIVYNFFYYTKLLN